LPHSPIDEISILKLSPPPVKLALPIVKDYDVIVAEHLSLKGMSQALNLGKSVMDAGAMGLLWKNCGIKHDGKTRR
jgi:hypothetical protein